MAKHDVFHIIFMTIFCDKNYVEIKEMKFSMMKRTQSLMYLRIME